MQFYPLPFSPPHPPPSPKFAKVGFFKLQVEVRLVCEQNYFSVRRKVIRKYRKYCKKKKYCFMNSLFHIYSKYTFQKVKNTTYTNKK